MTDTEELGKAAPTGHLLAAQTARLEEFIRRANTPGNLDGLLAHHILSRRRLSFDWDVNPLASAWLADNEHRFAHSHGLAVLGYGLAGFSSTAASQSAARKHLTAGLPALMRKNSFQDDGVTFVNDPRQIIGLALAVNTMQDDTPQARAWLADVLQDPRLRPANVLLSFFQEYARRILGTTNAVAVDARSIGDPVEAACIYWLTVSARDVPVTDQDELRRLQSRLLSDILLTDAGQPTAPRAALLLEATAQIVTASIDETLLSRTHVGVLLSRFEAAMRQWRYDGDDLDTPIKWPITSEREIQNILWLMLRPVFDDLVEEETLRRLGHSTYRADFGIPSLALLIEVKYACRAADFKTFEKEIYDDYIGYLAGNSPYRQMTVFIYDEYSSVQEHGTTRNALLKLPNITDVIIVSRPSHIPKPKRTPRRRHSRNQQPDDAPDD
ncbi:PD-(D/E)XK nuclease domain-containing protein [Streptomyces sp. NPDC001840]